jgi:mRNA interferase MazF
MASHTNREILHLPGRADAAPAAVGPAASARYQIRSTPKIRNVYYCGFPEPALVPEFSKRRPVIVVSYKNSLSGPVLVVPLTTRPQPGNPWAVKLERNPTPGETCDVWVVCNHLYTVSCARLTATHGAVPRLSANQFRPIHQTILNWLPALDQPGDVT